MDIFRIVGRFAIEGTDQARQNIEGVAANAESSEGRISGAFKKIGAAVATYFVADKIIDFRKACVNATAEVSAEASAFEQIMGDYSDDAQEKINEIADATGMVNTRLTPYMTSMTAKFKGLGYDIEDATDYAKDGLTLAADAAAFWDMSLDDSMSHLNSFVNGSYEGGEAIGLFANDTQMAAYAVEKGLVSEAKEWSALEESIKQATRLEYAQNMMEQSGAVGQAAKESGQYANVMANLSEKWRQFQAAVGEPILEAVLPIIDILIGMLEEITPVLTEIAAGIVPKLADIIEMLLPFLLQIVEAILPVVMDILNALLPVVENLISSLLPTAVDILKNISEILQAVLKFLTPVLDVVSEIASVILGIGLTAIEALTGAFSDGEKSIKRFTDEEQAALDKTKELGESLDESAKAREESFKSIESEYGYYERLFKELETIVDENGKIKEGYEERAETITGILSDAAGVEAEINGNQIQNYKDLKDSIYDAIEAEKNKALLEAGKADYDEAIKNSEEYMENMEEADRLVEENQRKMLARKGQIENLSRMSTDQVNNLLTDIFPDDPTKYVDDVMEALPILQEDYEKLASNQKNLNQNAEDSKKIWSEAESYINNYGKALHDVDSKSEEAGLSILKMQENFQTAETANLETLKLQSEEIKSTLDKRTDEYKQGKYNVTKEEVDLLNQLYKLAKEEENQALETGRNQGRKHAEGLASQAENVGNTAAKIADRVTYGLNSVDGYGAANAAMASFNTGLINAAYQIYSTASSIASTISQTLSNISVNVSGSYSGSASKPVGHAKGGIVTREHIARVGEDGAEAIIPLEKNTQWIDKVAERINISSGSSDAVIDKLTELNESIKSLKIYIDGKTLVGEIAPQMDRKLGNIARRKRRG